MADAVIGSSYLQVIPKMDVSSLKGEMNGMAGPSGAAGNAAGLEFGKLFSKAAKALVALGVGKAILDLGRASVDAYSDFEQLSGGIQKIFDEMDYGSIAADADRAYAEMGMSANRYMSAMTDVGATLAASLGDQRGYDAAREGLMAISDYASGTGKDMDELTDKFTLITRSTSSYQSIADQFSGILPATSAGFLEAAQQAGYLSDQYKSLTEVPVDEYQEAVTHMLSDGVEQLGLAGNTAAEAAETYAGSLAAMQSAFEDWKVALAGGGDLGAQTEKLVDTVVTYLSNLVPRVGEVVRGMVATIPLLLRRVPGILQTALRSLPDLVRSIFGDAAADGLVEFMKPFMGLRLSFQAVVEPIQAAIAGMMERIQGHLADAQPYVDSLMTSVGGLVAAFGSFVEVAAPVAAELLGNLVSRLVGLLPLFSEAARVVVELATAMLDLATSAIAGLTESWSTLGSDTQAAWDSIKSAVSGAVDGLKSSVSARWEEIKSKVSSTVDNMRVAVTSKFNAIKSSVSGAVNGIKTTVSNAFSAVKTAMTTPIESAKTAISSAISSISSIVSGVKLSLPHFPLPHFHVSGGSAPWGIGGAGSPPSFGVDWYARGGFFSEPTVFLPGVGERGTELAWPSYEPYFSKYAQGIADAMPGQGQEAVVAWLDRNLGPVIHANVDHLSRRDFNRMAREAVRAGA